MRGQGGGEGLVEGRRTVGTFTHILESGELEPRCLE